LPGLAYIATNAARKGIGRLRFSNDTAYAGIELNMDKKEINSPKLTANFLFWIAGVGGVLLVALLHYVWRVF
jgi:hypothetical protein